LYKHFPYHIPSRVHLIVWKRGPEAADLMGLSIFRGAYKPQPNVGPKPPQSPGSWLSPLLPSHRSQVKPEHLPGWELNRKRHAFCIRICVHGLYHSAHSPGHNCIWYRGSCFSSSSRLSAIIQMVIFNSFWWLSKKWQALYVDTHICVHLHLLDVGIPLNPVSNLWQ